MTNIKKRTLLRKWKILDSKIVFNTRWYKVRQEKVEIRPGKVIGDYFFGVFPNIVLIFAVTKGDKVIMVRQYKHGARKILLEVPAGYIDKGETPLQAAKRELLEETGYRAKQWKNLGFFYSNPTKERGNRIFIFFAKDATAIANPKLDSSEAIQVSLVPKAQLIKKIRAQKIQVAGTALAIFLSMREL